MSQGVHDVLVLGEHDCRSLLEFEQVVEAVNGAYVALAREDARLFPLVREPLDGAMFGIRSAHWASRELLGVKISGYFPANVGTGRDNHQATVALVSPSTGLPRALVAGNYVTWVRTAAAGAIGTRALASANARQILIIGNGVQAAAQAFGHATLLADRDPEIYVHAPRDEDDVKAGGLVARLQAEGIRASTRSSLADALSEADVVVTATLAREPLFSHGAVRAGMHVTAIGSDAPGKRELDPELVRASRLVVEDREQSTRFGEAQGLDVDSTLIGELLRGDAAAGPDAAVTIFDSTGLGLLDLVTAELAYSLAIQRGLGTWISLV
jgi:alanine dehydrogenase